MFVFDCEEVRKETSLIWLLPCFEGALTEWNVPFRVGFLRWNVVSSLSAFLHHTSECFRHFPHQVLEGGRRGGGNFGDCNFEAETIFFSRRNEGFEVGAPVTALGGVLKKPYPFLEVEALNPALESLGKKEHPLSKARPIAAEEWDG